MSATAPIRVDIASDVVCPWCIIGYRQLAQAAENTGIEIDVHWHPFELNPHMPEEGQNTREHLAEKYGTTSEQSKAARTKLTEVGKSLGITFSYSEEARMWNTFRAHQLIDFAEEHGKGHDVKMALFEAYFTDNKNVSNLDVLADIGAAAGLSRQGVMGILQTGARAENVRFKQQAWIDNGIQGVPAMIFQKRHMVVGAQGIENYTKILNHLASHEAA